MYDEYDYRDMYAVPTNKFAVASVTCGALSIITINTLYLAIVFGSLAIIFGVLSRNGTKKLAQYAKIGMICGGIAIAGAVAYGIYVYIKLPTLLQDPQYREMLEKIMKSLGMDIDLDKLYNLTDTTNIL